MIKDKIDGLFSINSNSTNTLIEAIERFKLAKT